MDVSLSDFARLVDKMFGGDTAQSLGPAYVHRHKLPEPEEEMAAGPEWHPFTVEKLAQPRGLFGTPVSPAPPFPVRNKQQEVPEAFRREP